MRKEDRDDEGGWSNVEAMAALLMAVIAMTGLAAAAVESFKAASRLQARAASIIEARNGESDAVIGLIER